MSKRDEKMKCPYGDVKTDYKTLKRFVNHMKKKHGVYNKTAIGLYNEALKLCPECLKPIPSSCIGCPACAHIFDERLIKLYKEHKKRR